MRALVFAPRGVHADGQLVCSAVFRERSGLEAARVCEAARAVKAALAAHVPETAIVEIFDPLVPEARAWSTLFRDAITYALGTAPPSCLIVRTRDARRLVASAFNEAPAPLAGALSPIEMRVLDRLVHEIARGLEPLTGPVSGVSTVGTPHAYRSYFEMRFGAPIDATVGVALDEAPGPVGPHVAPATLGGIELECSAQIPLGTRSAWELAELRVGSIVRIDTKVAARAALKVGGQTIATGECGSHAGSAAFFVRNLSIGDGP